MKKTLLTTLNWFISAQPKASIDMRSQELLSEKATVHINQMVADGFTEGELNAQLNDNNKEYRGSWSIIDATRPLDLYNQLVKGMKADIFKLIREQGVECTFDSSVKSLDIGRYELELAGEHIEFISETHLYTNEGLLFNLCLLETELARVLSIIEDIQYL